jgi:uncharacterized protein (TIGR03435 family)
MVLLRSFLLSAVVSPGLYAVLAQAPQPAPAASKPLVFEAASIRPNTKEQYNGVDLTPDGARAIGISVKNLIRSAYNENHDQLWSGEPAWTASEHYDLMAKFDASELKDVTDDQRREMLQALLADRFKLVVHRETKALPHYALVVAKGGPRMQETKSDAIKLDDEKRLYCRAGLSVFRQCTMAEFARIVSSFGLNAVVEDKTGLTARYDFNLMNWVPMSASASAAAAADPAPTIFDAVRDQMGLQLQPVNSPLNIIVVDHVERPSEN